MSREKFIYGCVYLVLISFIIYQLSKFIVIKHIYKPVTYQVVDVIEHKYPITKYKVKINEHEYILTETAEHRNLIFRHNIDCQYCKENKIEKGNYSFTTKDGLTAKLQEKIKDN